MRSFFHDILTKELGHLKFFVFLRLMLLPQIAGGLLQHAELVLGSHERLLPLVPVEHEGQWGARQPAAARVSSAPAAGDVGRPSRQDKRRGL